MIALCLFFPLLSTYLVQPFLVKMFHETITTLISSSDLKIMFLMLCTMLILPVMVRLLTFGKKNKIVISYMGGANAGDDRHFTDSFGQEKSMYLANWYMEDLFGEKKILKPSLVLASADLIVLMIVAIGGVM